MTVEEFLAKRDTLLAKIQEVQGEEGVQKAKGRYELEKGEEIPTVELLPTAEAFDWVAKSGEDYLVSLNSYLLESGTPEPQEAGVSRVPWDESMPKAPKGQYQDPELENMNHDYMDFTGPTAVAILRGLGKSLEKTAGWIEKTVLHGKG